jgi:CHAT domain-containing protein/tetratricopeptide (TPR) repeat protein
MRRFTSSLLILSVLVVANPILWSNPMARSATTQVSGKREEADRLFRQGVEQYEKQQLKLAIASWQRSLELYRDLQDQSSVGTTLKNLSAVYLELQNYDAAITHLEQYLAIVRASKNHQAEQTALITLAETSVKQGRYAAAIDYYQQSLAIIRQQNDRPAEARVLGNLAIAHKVLGHYATAVQMNQAAIQILQALNDQLTEGRVLGNLGNTYEALGDYDQAIAAFEKSIQIAQAVKDEAGAATSHSNLGAVYANLGQYDKATSLQEQSLKISQSLGNKAGEASTLINLGSIFHALNQPKQAIEYYQQSLQIAQTTGDLQRQAEALGSLGLAHEDLQNYPIAIEHHQKSFAIAQSINNPRLQIVALNNLGHTLFQAKRLAKAEKALRSAIQLADSLRLELADAYQVSVFDTQLQTYSLLQQVLIASNQPEAALEASEQGRARAFATLLTRRMAERSSRQGKKAAPQLEQSPTIQQIRQIARQQNATLVEYAMLPSDEFKFRGKQRAPAAGLFIWVVRPDGKVIFRQVDLKTEIQPTLPNANPIATSREAEPANRSLSDLVQNTRTAIRGLGVVANESNAGGVRNQPIEFSANDPSRVQYQLQQLHQILIQPIADVLPTNPDDRVIFIPQESLFLVPFPALQDSEEKYLIEKHTILTAPSIQVLAFTEQQQRSRGAGEQGGELPAIPALVVGNPTMPKIALATGNQFEQLTPLPGAEAEAIAIAKLLKTEALTGAAGTKATVLQQMPQAPLIHLATHGLLEYTSPGSQASLSGLGIPGAIALAPSGKDDGLLTASEILTLQLQANLVVLSACDTGQGRITGDGVVGLSRAFIAAGVPSVVVSLWAVPDAPTAQLMTAFYENLQQQPDKAKALRHAMLATLKDHPNPLDWAAFTLIGEAE